MKKMKNDNKGFTLVELIVVLVILAILAAILVPALLGYIDEAKQKQIVLDGKSAYTASQAVMSELYAQSKAPVTIESSKNLEKKIFDMMDVKTCYNLSIGVKKSTGYSSSKFEHTDYTIAYIAFTEGNATESTTMYLYDNAWNQDDLSSKDAYAVFDIIVAGKYKADNSSTT